MTRYSKKQVIEAGKLIAAKHSTVTPDLIGAFQLAHDWRGSHFAPMRRVRTELMYAARKVEAEAIIAARLKRLQSIRRKMQRRPISLFQMQDIAGARAIMSDMPSVDRLLDRYRAGGTKYDLRREWDYITEPKAGGYRGCHLRLVCPQSSQDDAYSHMAVEVQIRTRLQHAWATAVEAVGLVRNEELKTGIGSASWLRLFELMSSEIATLEDKPIVPGTPATPSLRSEELAALVEELDAIHILENYNHAMKATENIRIEPGAGYVIRYNHATRQAKVETFSRFSRIYDEVLQAEMRDVAGANDTVTVEVDRVDDLRRAYPNYFLDVRDFTKHLKAAVNRGVASTPEALRSRSSKWADVTAWLVHYQARRKDRSRS